MAEGALYDVVLLAHIGVGLIGYGSMATTGYYSAEAKRLSSVLDSERISPEGRTPGVIEAREARVRRYFAPGRNLAAHFVYLVPMLGVALLVIGSHGSWLAKPWLLTAFVLWAVSVGVAHARLLPAQTRLQKMLSGGGASASDVAAVARSAEVAASVISLCFLGAVVLMVAQPG